MPSTAYVSPCDLRREFSARLSAMYTAEVPLYGRLIEVVRDINREVIRARPELGLCEDEVVAISEERHGAIRLGREDEMKLMARFFAVLGMQPVNTYDLSAAGAKAQPVLSTAFRPVTLAEIEASPLRVFCSLLRPDDGRFFDNADLRERTKALLARREIFTPRLRALIATAEQNGGLTRGEADAFLAEGLRLFGWSGQATDRALYEELIACGLNIAADIACFPNPHLNHLTPNTLDIDALQSRMRAILSREASDAGAEMKDHIEGPPAREHTVLLRQTSYKALTEKVHFDGEEDGAHTARFGEIEQRGIALTPEGRRRYDEAIAMIEGIRAEKREPTDAEVQAAFAPLPDDLEALRRQGLGHFFYSVTDRGAAMPPDRCPPDLNALVAAGLVEARPIRYEDFLPVSAAGIFASNLRQAGARHAGESPNSQAQLEAILGRAVVDGAAQYARQEARSIRAVYEQLGLTPLSFEAKEDLINTVAHWRDTDLEDFSVLERGRPGTLELLLEPASEEELAALVGALRRHGLPTTTIAGQSGLVEAQRPHGIGILMRRFDTIGEITLADGTVVPTDRFAELGAREPADLRGAHLRVGAGVAIDTINAALKPANLKLPIVMGSTGSATAGACAANGSAGANAVRYGTAADMARHVRGVLGTGEVIARDVEPVPPVTDPGQCRIRADRFSHGEQLVGSQGTLGLITEITYELYPCERDQAVVLLPVPDMAAANHLREQLSHRFDGDGTALELFEIIRHATLERALDHADQVRREGFGEAPYYALVLLTSELATGPSALGSAFVESVLNFLMNEFRDPAGNLPYAGGNVDFDHAPDRLLHLREACSEMSRLLPKQSYDVVLPLRSFDTFVTRLESTLAADHPDLQLGLFGHGGVGALHLHLIATSSEELASVREELDDMVFDLVQELGGCPWAEHGVGAKWADQWRRRTPLAVQREMLAIKRQCDPDNVLGSWLFGFDQLLAET